MQFSEPCHMLTEQSLPISPKLRSKRVNVNDLVNLSGNDRETESIPDKYLIQSESYRNSLIINPKTQQSL